MIHQLVMRDELGNLIGLSSYLTLSHHSNYDVVIQFLGTLDP